MIRIPAIKSQLEAVEVKLLDASGKSESAECAYLRGAYAALQWVLEERGNPPVNTRGVRATFRALGPKRG